MIIDPNYRCLFDTDVKGVKGDDEYMTYLYEEMPYIFNPERGYIATANNKTIGNEFPYYISGLWADPSRIERIIELTCSQ